MSTLKQYLLKAGLVLAVFVGLNSVAKAMAPPITYDAVADVYQISTPGDLEILATFVADVGGIASSPTRPPYWTSQGKTFVLMNDIVGFSKSIGNSSHPFMGTFDGNGHKITLAISTSDLYYLKLHAGIFEYTSGATIKNLTVSGYITYFNDDPTIYPQSIGAIVNHGNNTTITNCINLADITIDCSSSIWIAGIAGYLYNSKITSCSNVGNIITTGDDCAGIGGIVGYMQSGYDNGSVSQCINIGKVKGGYYIGGIIGQFDSGTDGIYDCVNAGWVNADSHSGGLIGCVYELGAMQRCLNTGVVQGYNYVYALIGYSFSNSSLSSKVTRCYYDNQMAPYAAIQGIANPSGVQSLSTNELTEGILVQGIYIDWPWDVMPDVYSGGVPLMPRPQANQMYSYPKFNGNNSYISTLAALPVRLSNGNNWNNVNSVVTLDNGYWIYSTGYPRVGMFDWPTYYSSIFWEATFERTPMPIQSGISYVSTGSYARYFYNPAPPVNGIVELTVYMDDANGNRYKKTVPIFLNGTPFKIPINDYEMYGFEASEVSPNIVTNNAVMDVSSAIEGYLTVAIFDMSGAKVMEVVDKSVTAQSNTLVELNGLHDLPAGSYMVAVSLGDNVVFRRFIKE